MFKFVVLLALLTIVVVSNSDDIVVDQSVENAKNSSEHANIIQNYPILKSNVTAPEGSALEGDKKSSSVVSFVAALAILSAAF
ncbi:hypothetical protein PMAYCL1PPCAC_13140 [Pristionchus mayeri]|uniref:Uncharacterized protein n=1 Tax=Pristionchus mayeri TaxID=1317129 RepID=A0AAN4ZTJ3_9BILA|nr:hypothetical protein PMAYCL1PPCAC_13140 [Pristionchus mayeri]